MNRLKAFVAPRLKKLRKHPFISTCLAAAILSGLWSFMWMLVFFVSTWTLDLETSYKSFATAFWLSVGVESMIRWFENTNWIAWLAKPFDFPPRGDNQGYNFSKAYSLFTSVVLLFAVIYFFDESLTGLIEISSGDFVGQHKPRTGQGFLDMLDNWKVGMSQPLVINTLFFGFVVRLIIYKRSHKRIAKGNTK